MAQIEVTVQSLLPSDQPQGRFQIRIQRGSTVGDLLKQLCKEANVPVNDDYCLRSKGHDVLSRQDLLDNIEVEDGTFLHWTSEEVQVKSCTCNTLLSLAILSFLIGAGGIATICAIKFQPVSSIMDYAVVFDAGSTHTSMFVYMWDGSKYEGTAVASQLGDTCNVKGGGISSYENKPAEVAHSFDDCLKFAEKIIPNGKHFETPIYLGATAGMRLLNESNPKASAEIFSVIRDKFSETPFKLVDSSKSVRIISGEEEGTFAWVTSNYITNAFDVDKPWVEGIPPSLMYSSIGALDLGGASTQITFIPEKGTDMPPEYSHRVTLYGQDYNVYTHSFLCYGVMQMANTLFAELIKESNSTDDPIDHACLPKKYVRMESYETIFSSPCVKGTAESKNYTFLGTGDVSECRDLLRRTLFNDTHCPYSQCSFNGVYQPTVVGPFYAFSSFYYEVNFLNLTKVSASTQFNTYERAVTQLCNKTWSELEVIPMSSSVKANLMWYCLEGNYISLLLHNYYNFTEEKWPAVNFVKRVYGSDVGWTLGFILDASESYPVHKPSPNIYPVTYGLLTALFCLFIVVAIGLAYQSKKVSRGVYSKYSKMKTYGAI